MELALIIRYLEDRVLPGGDRLSKRIALSSSLYTMLDGMLYRVESDAILRVIPPKCARKQLFTAAHSGKFGGHLSDTKVYTALLVVISPNGLGAT